MTLVADRLAAALAQRRIAPEPIVASRPDAAHTREELRLSRTELAARSPEGGIHADLFPGQRPSSSGMMVGIIDF